MSKAELLVQGASLVWRRQQRFLPSRMDFPNKGKSKLSLPKAALVSRGGRGKPAHGMKPGLPLKALEEEEVPGAELPWSGAPTPGNKQALVLTQSGGLCSPK